MTTTPTPNITPNQGTPVKEKLADILDDINLKSLAEKGFGKTSAWLYQRLNGALVNGQPAELKPDQVKQLKQALNELGHRIIIASNRL